MQQNGLHVERMQNLLLLDMPGSAELAEPLRTFPRHWEVCEQVRSYFSFVVG